MIIDPQEDKLRLIQQHEGTNDNKQKQNEVEEKNRLR